ncbi:MULTISPECIES: hypothetical protein [unclassified Streptomyces]|uniref:hypothetical protein n=1 Tax=unclassified Streptomyces TaxID=2593676 RepID=UPI0037932ADB
MEAELTALAASGATTFVGLMATEAWTQARGRVARFLGRGEDDEAVDAELEESRAELTAARAEADEETAADIEAEWRTRLRRTLRANPEAAEELRSLLDELSPLEPEGKNVSINHNTISGGTYHGPVIMAQSIHDGGRTMPRREPGVR